VADSTAVVFAVSVTHISCLRLKCPVIYPNNLT